MKNLTCCILLFYYSLNIISQEIKRDTLFFDFNKSYILKTETTGATYILKDSNKDGTFYFERLQILQHLNPDVISCLKEYVRNSEFFRKGWKRELMDYSLSEHFENYVIFLIKKDKNQMIFIQVEPRFIIE